MKNLSPIFLILFLVGCQSTSTETKPSFATDIIEIEVGELSNFWVAGSSKVKILRKRPNWLPKGKGEWTVLTVIDSNGNTVENTLISSNPEGFMTQEQINKMPKTQFVASGSNNSRVPVKFYSTARVAPRNEL
ncbi:hypothetical protein EKO29_14560 [Colwellia sp. Arc7-635]|uniref:hypothetical protein n=1 Tax=Colwellia sp. Arc7-635 TaxID=2497879 RepID=UPI000F852AD1|nr:hypothetical protein [Colwellia sp. Arc7-635]AZQ85095.1 hypothetical protein EKO29_14560 [Colwellia sp. Arc7-635]